MSKKSPHRTKSARSCGRAVCENVHFAEIEFARSLTPRLVIQFSEGLSVLVDDESSVDLAAEFIAAFRASEYSEMKKGASCK